MRDKGCKVRNRSGRIAKERWIQEENCLLGMVHKPWNGPDIVLVTVMGGLREMYCVQSRLHFDFIVVLNYLQPPFSTQATGYLEE